MPENVFRRVQNLFKDLDKAESFNSLILDCFYKEKGSELAKFA